MKVLVIGSGGREHALVWKLQQDAEVFCTPGNAGIAEECETWLFEPAEVDQIVSKCREVGIELVVIGPENPLVDGLGDQLRDAGLSVFGPGSVGASLEGSKAFSKELMLRGGVQTARSETYDDYNSASAYIRSKYQQGRQVVVKASGAALGKGVVVAETEAEALEAAKIMLVDRVFGESGSQIVIEDRLFGREFSLITLVSEGTFWSLPVAQDHKRIFEGDRGPNTGGMGTFSPVSWLTDSIITDAEEVVVRPMVDLLQREGISYRGVLFSGIMVEDGKPYCLEYNVRFGDPEIQSLVMRLGSGFAETLMSVANGTEISYPDVLDNAAVTVVLASEGYPGSYRKGELIELPGPQSQVKIFHSGTKISDGKLVTNGGRVLGVTATAATVSAATESAYNHISKISFQGMQFRRDIAATSN